MRHAHYILFISLILPACASKMKVGGKGSVFNRSVASVTLQSPIANGSEQNLTAIVDSVIGKLGPARTQENTSFCFGFVGADIATFMTGQRVSAFSVVVRTFQNRSGLDSVLLNPTTALFNKVTDTSRYAMGFGSSMLASIQKWPLCADDQPASTLTYRDENLQRLWDIYEHTYRPYLGVNAPVGMYGQIKTELATVLPSLPSDEFIKAISRYKPLNQALGEWMDRRCQIRIPTGDRLQVVGNEWRKQTKDVVQEISHALVLGSLPVIHLSPEFLESNAPSDSQFPIGFHVASIVAEAKLDGVQLFLMRNSWGPKCEVYATGLRSRCDRRHLWMSATEVSKWVTHVSYFTP